MREREHQKAVLAIELRGDLTRDEEHFLRNQITEKMEKTKNLQKANEDSNKKLHAMEEAFAQIKQVTGVSSLEEMHEKFSSQKNNKKALGSSSFPCLLPHSPALLLTTFNRTRG